MPTLRKSCREWIADASVRLIYCPNQRTCMHPRNLPVTVLVVNDTDSLRPYFDRLLGDLPDSIQVVRASHEEEVVSLALNAPRCVVILGESFAGRPGLEWLQDLRHGGYRTNALCIAEQRNPNLEQDLRRLHCETHLAAELNTTILTETIHRALQQSRCV